MGHNVSKKSHKITEISSVSIRQSLANGDVEISEHGTLSGNPEAKKGNWRSDFTKSIRKSLRPTAKPKSKSLIRHESSVSLGGIEEKVIKDEPDLTSTPVVSGRKFQFADPETNGHILEETASRISDKKRNGPYRSDSVLSMVQPKPTVTEGKRPYRTDSILSMVDGKPLAAEKTGPYRTDSVISMSDTKPSAIRKKRPSRADSVLSNKANKLKTEQSTPSSEETSSIFHLEPVDPQSTNLPQVNGIYTVPNSKDSTNQRKTAFCSENVDSKQPITKKDNLSRTENHPTSAEIKPITPKTNDLSRTKNHFSSIEYKPVVHKNIDLSPTVNDSSADGLNAVVPKLNCLSGDETSTGEHQSTINDKKRLTRTKTFSSKRDLMSNDTRKRSLTRTCSLSLNPNQKQTTGICSVENVDNERFNLQTEIAVRNKTNTDKRNKDLNGSESFTSKNTPLKERVSYQTEPNPAQTGNVSVSQKVNGTSLYRKKTGHPKLKKTSSRNGNHQTDVDSNDTPSRHTRRTKDQSSINTKGVISKLEINEEVNCEDVTPREEDCGFQRFEKQRSTTRRKPRKQSLTTSINGSLSEEGHIKDTVPASQDGLDCDINCLTTLQQGSDSAFVSAWQLYNILNDGGLETLMETEKTHIVLLDARKTQNYEHSHIIGAQKVSHSDLGMDTTVKYKWCIIYDTDGQSHFSTRSTITAVLDRLTYLGHKAKILKGGFQSFLDTYPFMCYNEDKFLPGSVTHYPSEIIPRRLYLSAAEQAKSNTILYDLGILYILNIGSDMVKPISDTGRVMNLDFRENAKNDLLQVMPQLLSVMNSALGEPSSRILITCVDGNGKSAAAVILYLMYKQKWNLNQALTYVTGCRSSTKLSKGLLQQLQRCEKLMSRAY